MADRLFEEIARAQGDHPWGAVLDAGAGIHSLRWLSALPTERIVGVTASSFASTQMETALSGRWRGQDQLVVGNWTDPTLLAGQRFETVLADYLLGAVDGHAPYFQDRLFPRLRPHVAGRLYVVGLEPFPDGADTEAGRIVLEIARLRDACILLAGHRCYREYPRAWVERALEAAGFTVTRSWSLPIIFRERYVNGQLDVCVNKLPLLRDRALAETLKAHIEALRSRALEVVKARDGLRFGADYVVVAEPAG
ncbi:MAG: class I SAM-dependent methyltransferase [Alphaproteobacteria bacterium]|nr:class I SAM-dependent methyltransferase [Alphaproteobacteria bacterium]